MNSGPERKGRIDSNLLERAVREIHQKSRLEVVVFAGGEPTLEKATLSKSITLCKSLGITTRIVTNASWARTPESADRVLTRLKSDGLDEINISADDYHLPFISFDCVLNAWAASKGMGFLSVVVANAVGNNSIITPEFIKNRLVDDVDFRFDENGKESIVRDPSVLATYLGLSNGKLQRLARAKNDIPASEFESIPAITEIDFGCPFVIRSAAISPGGHLLACCGFELEGNPVLDFGCIEKGSVSDLLAQANLDVIVQAIETFGPVFLRKFIELVAPSFNSGDTFSSMCEACSTVVTNPEAIAILRRHERHLGLLVLWRRGIQTVRGA